MSHRNDVSQQMLALYRKSFVLLGWLVLGNWGLWCQDLELRHNHVIQVFHDPPVCLGPLLNQTL